MSVYTKISSDEISMYLKDYSVGSFESLEGISDGIENTNYVLKTTDNEYIFTIFENIKIDKVIIYLELMNFLNKNNFKCAKVHITKNNELCKLIQNKPAAIIEKIPGSSIDNINAEHCYKVGKLLGNFHLLSNNFSYKLKDSRDISWRKDAYGRLEPILTEDEKIFIEEALTIQKEFDKLNLPRGIIHADLFRDNVLFNSEKISGMIDFYYSCNGVFIYDLAVVANDWCTDDSGNLITDKVENLMDSYSSIRKFDDNEKDYWNYALVVASLRFYLSRLLDLHFPKIGEITHIKDPNVFKNILKNRLEKINLK